MFVLKHVFSSSSPSSTFPTHFLPLYPLTHVYVHTPAPQPPPQAEDEEKQTPLAVAGQEDIKLQGVMVQVAKGEVDVDELLGS